jgi:hypothetical protein
MSNFRIRRSYPTRVIDPNTIHVNSLGSNVVSLSNQFQFSQIAPMSMANKGINIDDTTVLLTPSSHNPPQTGDTFPSVWPGIFTAIGSIRTFHYNAGVGGSTWVLWAVKNGIKVIVGLDLGSDSGAAEITAFSTDYLAASPSLKALYDANIIAIAVGNEETNTTAINTGLVNAQNLKGLNQLPNVPITSVLVDINGSWIQNSYPPESATFSANFLTLAPNMDVICFNFYSDYYSFGNLPPLTPEQALTVGLSWTSNGTENSVLLNQFGAVRSAMAAAVIVKPFYCTETGWANVKTQLEFLAGWSSTAHEKTYYSNFLGFNLLIPYIPQAGTTTVLPPDKIFYFTVRDVPSENDYFGLYSSATTLTPKFT